VISLPQVPVGRADHPHVDDPLGPFRADLLQLAGFEESQHQRLHAQRHLADFVQEHGSRVGDFQLAGLVAIGAREAALDVAEELRLEKRLGQSRAVHDHEGSRGARPLRLNRASHEFLADAALPGDEHLGVRIGNLRDLLFQRAHRAAGSD
jgi:hypothetical protein